ncbi:MAG: WD40 repeat domain-containing protein [Candidatus Thorarchaeota archaeon]
MLWRLPTGVLLITLKGHKKTICTIHISPDKKYLASGSYDGIVKILDLNSRGELMSFNPYAKNVSSVAFSPYGKILAVGG